MTARLLSCPPHIAVAAAMAIAIGLTYHTGRSHGRALAEFRVRKQIQQQRDARDAEAAVTWTAHPEALDQQRRTAEGSTRRDADRDRAPPGRLEVRREIGSVASRPRCVCPHATPSTPPLSGHPVAKWRGLEA